MTASQAALTQTLRSRLPDNRIARLAAKAVVSELLDELGQTRSDEKARAMLQALLRRRPLRLEVCLVKVYETCLDAVVDDEEEARAVYNQHRLKLRAVL